MSVADWASHHKIPRRPSLSVWKMLVNWKKNIQQLLVTSCYCHIVSCTVPYRIPPYCTHFGLRYGGAQCFLGGAPGDPVTLQVRRQWAAVVADWGSSCQRAHEQRGRVTATKRIQNSLRSISIADIIDRDGYWYKWYNNTNCELTILINYGWMDCFHARLRRIGAWCWETRAWRCRRSAAPLCCRPTSWQLGWVDNFGEESCEHGRVQNRHRTS